MSKFALERVNEIKGRLNFFMLVCNGQNQYKNTQAQLEKEGNYDSELITLQSRMQEMAEMKFMPKTKCRDITPEKDSVKEYELKTKQLRLYVFHESNKGRIIVFLGKKTTQKKDIQKFRSIKKQYLNNI